MTKTQEFNRQWDAEIRKKKVQDIIKSIKPQIKSFFYQFITLVSMISSILMVIKYQKTGDFTFVTTSGVCFLTFYIYMEKVVKYSIEEHKNKDKYNEEEEQWDF